MNESDKRWKGFLNLEWLRPPNSYEPAARKRRPAFQAGLVPQGAPDRHLLSEDVLPVEREMVLKQRAAARPEGQPADVAVLPALG